VPPAEWQPECQVQFNNPKKFATKKQVVNTLQEGQGFDDGRQYNIAQYKAMADRYYKEWVTAHHADADTADGDENDAEDVEIKEQKGSHSDPLHMKSSSKADRQRENMQQKLAKDYWEIVETASKQATVEYANDLDTQVYCSGFPTVDSHAQGLSNAASVATTLPLSPNSGVKQEFLPTGVGHPTPTSNSPPASATATATATGKKLDSTFYTTTGWNLNNIPRTRGSLLQYLRTPINGINVPWLYIGMLFASFCWHNEDNYFYSISYNHFGATKQWYGVPGAHAAQFEKVRTTYREIKWVFFCVRYQIKRYFIVYF
jgi:hypothetical protein